MLYHYECFNEVCFEMVKIIMGSNMFFLDKDLTSISKQFRERYIHMLFHNTLIIDNFQFKAWVYYDEEWTMNYDYFNWFLHAVHSPELFMNYDEKKKPFLIIIYCGTLRYIKYIIHLQLSYFVNISRITLNRSFLSNNQVKGPPHILVT